MADKMTVAEARAALAALVHAGFDRRAGMLRVVLTHAADATGETMIASHWCDAVRLAAIHLGVSADFANAPEQRVRLLAAWRIGEPAWMALDTVCQLAHGANIADAEESDMRVIRRAVGSKGAK